MCFFSISKEQCWRDENVVGRFSNVDRYKKNIEAGGFEKKRLQCHRYRSNMSSQGVKVSHTHFLVIALQFFQIHFIRLTEPIFDSLFLFDVSNRT